MSEPPFDAPDKNNYIFTDPDPKSFNDIVSIAVSFRPVVTGDGPYWHVRRYFLAHWLGMLFGPLVMAFAPRSWKGINFGVTRNGKWSWFEVIRT